MTLSPYELERQETIAQNKRKLAELGLESAAEARSVQRRPRSAPVKRSPVRKSSRLSGGGNPKTRPTPAAEVNPTCLVPWEERVFSEECTGSGVGCKWDQRRHHQHLTLATDGLSVATTGVAGYGAALCAVNPRGGASWAVRAVRFGVGGFGVAVVRASMRPPYKSLGKSGSTVACYHSSGALTAGGHERPFGPAYSPGDTIGVVLRPVAGAGPGRRELCFLLNNAEVGVAASGLEASREAYVLAVQPYMGGVAQLVVASDPGL